MILEDSKAIELIKADSPSFIVEAQEKHKVLKAHVTGRGYVELLNKISEYENEKQKDARKKFAKSLKDVMSNILRPVDKVFSAKGYAVKYDTTPTIEAQLSEGLRDFDNEMTIKSWIKNTQKARYFYDPAGFVFYEWGVDYLKPKTYSIMDVHCYKVNGRGLDFVIFAPYYKKKNGETLKDATYYRVVDDASDRVFKKVGDNVSLVQNTEESQEIFENPWGKVPAVLNSNIPSDCGNYMDSPLEVLSELATKYLRNDSIKSIYEFLHGYPIFWMYASKEPCEICTGLGYINANGGVQDECPSCHGVGHQFKKDVTTGYFLKPPQEKDEPTIAPTVAGYVQPDLETWREQRVELEWLYDAMHFALWGTTQSTREKNETATARFLDLQPVNDRLYDFSEAFEDMQTRLTKFYCSYFFPDAVKSITVVYGKRFIMESPDAIWLKYQAARKEGAPEFTKNHLLEQFYQSEYEHDPEMLAYSLKGIRVEPHIHQEAKELYDMQVSPQAKLLFSQWWQDQGILDVLRKTSEQLRQEFEAFVQSKTNNQIIKQ